MLLYRPISKAEKEELLAKAGEPWPICECHGEPKQWSADRFHGEAGGGWRCLVVKRDKSNRLYRRNQDQGRCNNCWELKSECFFSVLCYECRAEQQVKKVDESIQKYERLLKLDTNDPEYIAIVRRERTING